MSGTKQQQAQQVLKLPQPKIVTITVDAAGNITVTPDPVHVNKGLFEQVKWEFQGPGHTFEVDLHDDIFVHCKHFTHKNPVSGRVRSDVPADPNTAYKYQVTVDDQFELDPRIVVD